MIPPYRDIFFESISLIKEVENLTVFICKKNEPNRSWDNVNSNLYKIKKLKGFSISFGNSSFSGKVIHFYPGIFLELLFNKPEHLIIGDISYTTYIALFIAKVLRLKSILWFEDSRDTKDLTIIARVVKNIFYKFADLFIVPSLSSKNLLRELGIDNKKIKIIPNAINNQKFFNLYKKNKDSKNLLRKKYNVPISSFCFVFVGQLIKRKRILETIQILDNKKIKAEVFLIIIGKGYLEKEVKLKIKNLKNLKSIYIKEINEELISEVYSLSDSLILLSDNEPWGMVINESMIHNLPFITSDNVEAANYYYRNYKNSTVENFTNINHKTIKNHIAKSKSKNINNIKPISPEKMAKTFIKFIKDEN